MAETSRNATKLDLRAFFVDQNGPAMDSDIISRSLQRQGATKKQKTGSKSFVKGRREERRFPVALRYIAKPYHMGEELFKVTWMTEVQGHYVCDGPN